MTEPLQLTLPPLDATGLVVQSDGRIAFTPDELAHFIARYIDRAIESDWLTPLLRRQIDFGYQLARSRDPQLALADALATVVTGLRDTTQRTVRTVERNEAGAIVRIVDEPVDGTSGEDIASAIRDGLHGVTLSIPSELGIRILEAPPERPKHTKVIARDASGRIAETVTEDAE